jgi:hypothetical protein
MVFTKEKSLNDWFNGESLGSLSGGARSILSVAMIEFALAPFPTCEFTQLELSKS